MTNTTKHRTTPRRARAVLRVIGIGSATLSLGACGGGGGVADDVTEVTPETPRTSPTTTACALGNVREWDAVITLNWAHSGTSAGGRVDTEHSIAIRTPLRRTYLVAGIAQWTGRPAGTGSISDRETKSGSPPSVTTIRGSGTVLTTVIGDVPAVDVTLDADLQGCRYKVSTAPWIQATATEPDGRSQTAAFTIGTLHSAWTAANPAGGALSVGARDVPAHGPAWLLQPGNAEKDFYIPAGLSGPLFGANQGAATASAGQARVGWTFTPR